VQSPHYRVTSSSIRVPPSDLPLTTYPPPPPPPSEITIRLPLLTTLSRSDTCSPLRSPASWSPFHCHISPSYLLTCVPHSCSMSSPLCFHFPLTLNSTLPWHPFHFPHNPCAFSPQLSRTSAHTFLVTALPLHPSTWSLLSHYSILVFTNHLTNISSLASTISCQCSLQAFKRRSKWKNFRVRQARFPGAKLTWAPS
jgi:hypothetical protein